MSAQEEIKHFTEELIQSEKDLKKLNHELTLIKNINCPLIKKCIELYKRNLTNDIEYNILHINRLNNLLNIHYSDSDED